MAFAALNPLAALWRQRGLTCLLMPPGFDAFAPTPPTATAASTARVTALRAPAPAGLGLGRLVMSAAGAFFSNFMRCLLNLSAPHGRAGRDVPAPDCAHVNIATGPL